MGGRGWGSRKTFGLREILTKKDIKDIQGYKRAYSGVCGQGPPSSQHVCRDQGTGRGRSPVRDGPDRSRRDFSFGGDQGVRRVVRPRNSP